MEGHVDYPVEVVRQNAHVPVSPERCVGEEVDGLASGDYSLALVGRQDVRGDAEAGHGRMGVVGCGWAGGSQWDSVRGGCI